jgi:hypothetical protein
MAAKAKTSKATLNNTPVFKPQTGLTIGGSTTGTGSGPYAPTASASSSAASSPVVTSGLTINGAAKATAPTRSAAVAPARSASVAPTPTYTRPAGPPEGFNISTDSLTTFRGATTKQLDKLLERVYTGKPNQVKSATKALNKLSTRMIGGVGVDRSFTPGSYEDIIGYATGAKTGKDGKDENSFYPVFGKKPAPTFTPEEQAGMDEDAVEPEELDVPDAMMPEAPAFPQFNFTMPDPVLKINSGAAIAGNATGFKRKESRAKSAGRTNKGTSQLRINPTLGNSSLGINLGT